MRADVIQPMNDFVFVRPLEETVSPGGIVLAKDERPWSADNREHKEGVVVAVGPGKLNKHGRRESMWGLAPGQRIAYSPNGNFIQSVDGEDLVVIRRDSVIGEKEDTRASA